MGDLRCSWRLLRAGLIALVLYALVALVNAEPVAQAQAHHGGTIVVAQRTGPCPAGHLMALDLRPSGLGAAAVGGCARITGDFYLIRWRGWPREFAYPRAAFTRGNRDLRWVGV